MLSFETEVLVIGGGMAAAWADIAAAQEGVTVTLVDKGYVGTSGVTATADRTPPQRPLHPMQCLRRRLPHQCVRRGAGGGSRHRPPERLQTCYICEMYCPADALFVGSDCDHPELADPAAVIASGQLGRRIRRDSGWGEWADDPRYQNQMWYMGEVFKRARDCE